MPDRLQRLRNQITTTIEDGTDFIADLKAVAGAFALVMPSLNELTEPEREEMVARLCGWAPELPRTLGQVIENLADVLAGLTTADGGRAWLKHQLSTLEAGEERDDQAC